MQQEPKRVLAVVTDLFFSVKLADLAKAKQRPSLIIFDLNFDAAEPLKLIAKLKGDSETKGISLLGYLSHVQGELKQQAHEAGCNMVLARSQFSQNMLHPASWACCFS